jgi:hypothetical protein
MKWNHREPTLEEILSSPITKAVMAADGVDPGEVEAMVRRIARVRRAAADGAKRGQGAALEPTSFGLSASWPPHTDL